MVKLPTSTILTSRPYSPKLTNQQTNKPMRPIEETLLERNGSLVSFNDRTYKLSVSYGHSRYYGRDYFKAYVENITPANQDEAKYCITPIYDGSVCEGELVLEIIHRLLFPKDYEPGGLYFEETI